MAVLRRGGQVFDCAGQYGDICSRGLDQFSKTRKRNDADLPARFMVIDKGLRRIFGGFQTIGGNIRRAHAPGYIHRQDNGGFVGGDGYCCNRSRQRHDQAGDRKQKEDEGQMPAQPGLTRRHRISHQTTGSNSGQQNACADAVE